MKIKYLLLENFSIVKGAMGLNKLELDFTNHNNRITLIIGSNGSGKTGGILANLHPYAGLGHLEEREDSDLIIKGKKGHKQIIFCTKKHEYVIDHFYTWLGKDKSRKISSYCKKDGIELNKTGLVTTFNTIIESEFGIDINFLKLMREIDDFIKDQKKVAERSSLLNNALKIAIDKKRKLNVEDLTLLNEEIEKKEKRVNSLKKEKENTIKKFFAYKGSIDSSTLERFDELVNKYKKSITDLKEEYYKLPKPNFVHIIQENTNILESYNNELRELNNKKNELTSILATMKSQYFAMDDKIREINNKMIEATENIMLDKEISNKESELTNYLNKLESDVNKYETEYENELIPSLSRSELDSDLDKLHMILFHIEELHTMSDESLDILSKLYLKYDLDYDKMSKKIQKKSKEISYMISQLTNKDNNELIVLYLPDKCSEWKECPYYHYGKMKCKIENKQNKIESLLVKQKAYEEVNTIIGSLIAIRKILSLRKNNITAYEVTEKGVIESVIYGDIKYFIDEEILNKLNTHIESYEIYLANKKNIDETKKNLERINDTNKYIKELLNEKDSYMNDIKNIAIQINNKNKELEPINSQISIIESMILDYNIFMNLSFNKMRIENELKEAKYELDKLKKLENDKIEYDRREKEYNENISFLTYTINQEETELYNLKKKDSIFKELEKEIEEIQIFYDYVELIKKSVSNKEGIPKEYVIYYCRALRNIANEIIRDIYGGDLELDIFEITDTKFNIPYITKGVRVEDIRFASQAEVSVATIALSFAILFQFLPKYNIILLDEIDGPLHSKNKDRLFASLESHLDKIGREQLFWITQSKMYNDYPVNLIITDPNYPTSEFSNKSSIIFQR